MTEIACVVEAHDALGECCLWCPTTRRVWWLDIQKPMPAILRSGRAASIGSIPCPASTAAARRCANPAASCWRLDNGLHGFDPANGKLSFLIHRRAG